MFAAASGVMSNNGYLLTSLTISGKTNVFLTAYAGEKQELPFTEYPLCAKPSAMGINIHGISKVAAKSQSSES